MTNIHSLVWLGLAIQLFAGFSAFQFVRSDEYDTTASFSLPMLQVYALLAVSIAVVLAGALKSVPEFKSTSGIKHLNSMKRDEFLDRQSFRRYNHRARALHAMLVQANNTTTTTS